ncbi:protein of unknown function DUF81 [Thermodesulfobium narugense DSM 14796]|uniref:Probable membrane transporter protein n=1 Tax=Thermodesulfobium narugense DSM 14796 TaxID=747365 RepID=M1E6S8_9BACT|nr:sulfite exporter TauE/SafE family protein [Thermodesulfobium narugense]AEE13719.1 protein of unknown function DUF81 [Thermodesulfobium narugense DSM 14796]
MNVYFPVSGVNVNVFVPPVIAFVISFFTSMGGISGAFLILPFQVSFLNYNSPGVSGTNFIYNIVAIPGGVYRYFKEGRMFYPLAVVLTIGTLPGVFIGYYIRVKYLYNPVFFKAFVGVVLLYIGVRLLFDLAKPKRGEYLKDFKLKILNSNIFESHFEFQEKRYSFSNFWVFLLAFFVGIIGGAYGIGGGSIIAPFCVAVFKLPVYIVAGPALLATWITSILGVFYYAINPLGTSGSEPDVLLGILFGVGGIVGTYLGARCQKYLPSTIIKIILSVSILFLAAKYIFDFVLKIFFTP